MKYTEGKNYLWQPMLVIGICYLLFRQGVAPFVTQCLFLGLIFYAFIAQLASGVALNRYWTASYPSGTSGFVITLIIYGVCVVLMAGYLFAPEITTSALDWKDQHVPFLGLPEPR